MALPQKQEPIKPNCRYCLHGGEVNNHMCMCDVLKLNRAACIRICASFDIDKIKYNLFKNQESC